MRSFSRDAHWQRRLIFRARTAGVLAFKADAGSKPPRSLNFEFDTAWLHYCELLNPKHLP